MILVALLGCATRLAAGAHGPTDPAAPHGADVLAARDAVVTADLPRFQEAVRRLGREFPLPGHPAEQAVLQTALQHAEAAPDLVGAAVALGEVGIACGQCHTATHAVVPALQTDAAQGDGVRPEMARHDRALALAWSGLVRPSDADLQAAAAAFAASSLRTVGGELSPAAAELDDAVTRNSAALARSVSPSDRAVRFGELVVTCAGCHNAPPGGLGGEPD